MLLAGTMTSLPSDPKLASSYCDSTSTSLGYEVTIPAALRSLYEGSPLYVIAGGQEPALRNSARHPPGDERRRLAAR